MTNRKLRLIIFLATLAFGFNSNAREECTFLFSSADLELSRVERLHVTERLNSQERYSFYLTTKEFHLSSSDLYKRYAALERYSRSERAMVISPKSLVHLAAVSLVKSKTVEEVTKSLEILQSAIRARNRNGNVIHISNSVHVQLADALFRHDLSAISVATVYNKKFMEILNEYDSNPNFDSLPPAYLALERTLRQIEQP